IFSPTSAGPGIADLPWLAVAPTSLAYSGSMLATGPPPLVARCHTPMKVPNSSSDTSAARHVTAIVAPPATRLFVLGQARARCGHPRLASWLQTEEVDGRA